MEGFSLNLVAAGGSTASLGIITGLESDGLIGLAKQSRNDEQKKALEYMRLAHAVYAN